jgi:class 3 adenylate cyclase/predicted ATPase
MQQVADWLKKLGMTEYTERFAENKIDISVLPDLTEQHLKDLGVALGHRLKMLRAIRELGAVAATAPVTPTATEPTRQDDAERRQLTVMFCDLVGSTALSTRLDPEDLRSVIGAYHQCVAETVAPFDGFVAKYMGDGVLIYFGYPHAHEDDAERAVRAGLALIEAVGKLRVQEPLQARIGAATGLVVVGDLVGSGEAQERGVVGETPNLAARLQALAEPGTLMIASSTRRLTGELFEYHDLGAVALKGFAKDVSAWQVLGASTAESRFEALRATTTPLIGRDEEIDLLMRRWGQAKQGEGRVVLISGEPGIGKSRIAQTVAERISAEPHTRLRYFCSLHHQDSALYPSIAQLERAAGFRREDTADERLAKLEAVLARATHDLSETVTLLSDLLSIPTGDRYPPLNLTPQKRKEKTLHAQLAQVEGLAGQQPVLMVWEDVHWSDPTTRESLDLLIDRVATLRVLVVITFRPEFAPPWIGRPHVTMLNLNRLPPRQRAEMIAHVAGGRALPKEIVEQIVDRTDGVPLFIEELTKSVIESGVVAEAGDHYQVTWPLTPLTIPTSLQASLLARLDRLAPVRQVAQIAAALGRQFSHELISAAAGMPQEQLDHALEQLVTAELMLRRGIPPDAEYTFKHALVQDAAYSTLLKARRQQIHGKIVITLEQKFPDVVAAQPALLAQHCTDAGLAQKAIGYWLNAGRKSVSRSAVAEAVSQLRRGLELVPALPVTPERQRLELELQSALGGALVASRGIAAPETGSAYARARVLCEQLGDSVTLIPVLSGQISHHFGRAEYALAQRTAEDLLRLAQSRGDTASELVGSRSMGLNLHLLGKFRAAARSFERVLQLYAPNEHGALTAVAAYDMRALALTYLSVDLFILGHTDEALSRGEEAMAWSRQLNHPHTLGYAISLGAMVHLLRRENEKAEALTEEVLALAAAQNLPVWLPSANVLRGYLRVARGDTEALAFARQGIAAKNAQGSVLNQPFFLSLLAASCERAGKAEEALSLLAEAFAIAERTGERWFEAELYRLRGDWLLVHCSGMEAEAETCLHRALALARQQAAIMWELRAAVSLARFWSGRGRLGEASDLLVPLCDAFARTQPIPDIEAARALLIELR